MRKNSRDITALYLIAASEDGPTKIGISRDPDHRLKELQSGHARPLHVFHATWLVERKYAKKAEAWLHKELADKRQSGEWFSVAISAARELVTQCVVCQIGVKYLYIKTFAATDGEILGDNAPRHGALATKKQIERLAPLMSAARRKEFGLDP